MSKHIVVIVGVTGEMGSKFAAQMLRDGYKVIGVARSRDALEQLKLSLACGDDFIPCATSISDDQAISDIAALVDAPVKAVVHSPGVPTAGGVLQADTSALLEAVNIKAAGMVRLVRAVDANLSAGSRLIAIGGHYGFEPTAYAATAGLGNSALTNLIKQLSWAYGPRKITAHLIAPGPADTPRLHRVAKARAEKDGLSQSEVLAEMAAESALGEFTDVEDIVWAVSMLLSPHAKALAGSVMFMDTGRRRGTP